MNTFKAHEKPVYGLAFSPDGRSLLTSSGDELLRLWSLNPIAKTHEWPGSGYVCPVAISPDGRHIARGGRQTSLWEIGGSNKSLINAQFTEAIAFYPDGSVFIMHGNSSDGLRRWALPNIKELAGNWGGTRGGPSPAGGDQFPTGGMAVSPDSGIIATTFGVSSPKRYVSVVYLWDARTGKSLGALGTTDPSEHPTSLCFSPNGKLLAGASGALMRVWDVRKQKEIANLQVSKKHFKGQIFAPDGKLLYTIGPDEVVTRWNTRKWTKLDEIDCPVGKITAIARTPDGAPISRYAVGGVKGKVAIWDEP